MLSNMQRLYRRIRHGEPIVVVSGLPRSGTSMAMKMLEAGGLSIATDGIRRADEDNPKGYYELERVKDLAQQNDKSWLTAHRGKVVKIITYLLRHLPEDNNYKIVLMRRELEEVVASQNKMLDRRGEPQHTEDERMKDLFKDDLWRANYLLKRAPYLEAIEVEYRDVIADPLRQAQRMREFLGHELDLESMASVVDPQLYRNRAD
jgi:hypothetical protein